MLLRGFSLEDLFENCDKLYIEITGSQGVAPDQAVFEKGVDYNDIDTLNQALASLIDKVVEENIDICIDDFEDEDEYNEEYYNEFEDLICNYGEVYVSDGVIKKQWFDGDWYSVEED